MTTRQRLWLWGHPAGSHNGIYRVPGESRITPVEAACYLDIPNVIMVKYQRYGPEPPFDQFALPLRGLDQVVWSVVGASGETDAAARDAVFELAAGMPNITGVMMDDFFNDPAEGVGALAALSVEEVQTVRERLTLPDRTLDLWVVLYDYMLDLPVREYLELCDVVTFWTWEAAHLNQLESSFDHFEKVAGDRRKLLGCYMWDYGNSNPMPLDVMERQCEYGLQLLNSSRIEGMIFLASCICDLQLDAVEWTRRWIAENSRSPTVSDS